MKLLFIFVTLFCFLTANVQAAFTSEKPTTWRPNPSGSGGLYGPNGAPFFQGNAKWYRYMQDMKTPGSSTKIPWYMKMSPTAGAYFAAKAFTPAGLGLIALPFVIDWLSGQGVGYDKGAWTKTDNSNSNTDGREYNAGNGWHNSAFKACNSVLQRVIDYWAVPNLSTSPLSDQTCYYQYPNADGTTSSFSPSNVGLLYRTHPCPIGWVQVAGTCSQSPTVPMTLPEFEEIVTPLDMPLNIPEKLPFGLPVEDPFFNPNPAPNGTPEPIYSPTGLPYPTPGPRPSPDPTPFTEPGVKVTPAPKPAPEPDPFRKDEVPVEKPMPSSTPTSPTSSTGNTSGTQPPEKDPGLCALFPDILACEKLGDAPDSPELQDKQIDVSITPTGGFGSNNASCPPDKMIHLSLLGKTVPITYSYICSMATGVRPIVIALAWLSAAFIVIGMGRKS